MSNNTNIKPLNTRPRVARMRAKKTVRTGNQDVDYEVYFNTIEPYSTLINLDDIYKIIIGDNLELELLKKVDNHVQEGDYSFMLKFLPPVGELYENNPRLTTLSIFYTDEETPDFEGPILFVNYFDPNQSPE